MPKPITLKSFKEYIEYLSKEEMLDELYDLFNKCPEVKEYYKLKISPQGENELLKKYKAIIREEFFPARGFKGPSLATARKAVMKFKKLSDNPYPTADIMLYYVEMGVEFTLAYGDIDEPFYESMEKMYASAAKYVNQHNIINPFINRFKKIVDDTQDIGWGFHDTLVEMYTEYFPKKVVVEM